MDSNNDTTGAVLESSASEADQGFYAQDVDFRSGVIGFQMPHHMAVTAAIGGVVPPDTNQPFVYCDLGCGDGTTANAIGELYPHAQVVGIDFNPGHIRTARETSGQAGLDNVRFVEGSFSALTDLDLPDFDFIGMNGIYAWLEDAEAGAARAFVRDRLKPGGLFYVEYTSLPGKVSVQPLWGLIQYLVPPQAGESSRERARRGLDLTEALAKRGMAYLNAHRPAAAGAQSYVRGRKQDDYRVDHFAHNALASGFHPRYVTEVADEMAEAELTYAGRCELALNEIELSVPPAQVPTFQDFKDQPLTVELLKDYIRNEQARHDVFAKQAQPDRAAGDAWLDQNLRLLARLPAAHVQRSAATMGNQRVPLRGPAFEAVINGADASAVTPAEVAEADGRPIERVRKAAVRLLGTNQFFACRAKIDTDVPDPAELTGIDMPSAINRRTLALAADRLVQNQLISHVTGGPAIPVSPLEAVLLQSVLEAGGFADAPGRAQARLAEETRPLPTPKGQTRASEITTEQHQEVLDAIRGRKLTNMLRLGIVTPRT
jgi:SAM-dependent methyltransferase